MQKTHPSLHGVEEDLEESPLRDLYQVCQSAHASRSATDKHTVSQWDDFQDNLQRLADEVHNAAPAGLFPAGQNKAPAADRQHQQLQSIAQVCGL